MAEFISKLQYKTYEKGEFSEEKARTLDETLKLITNFPWDEQRGVDIQLTGPSVTIQNEFGEYFRINLYFSGKFCLYYLDKENHLYEYHTPNIDTACQFATDFFNQQLDLALFEKHLFNIGNQRNFVTNPFEYHVKLWRIISITLFFVIIITALTILDITLVKKDEFIYPSLIFVAATLVIGYVILKIGYNIIVNRNNYLQISKGNDSFTFGYTNQNHIVYNKEDVAKVVVYESKGKRDIGIFSNYEVIFKNGTLIRFSAMLISKFDLINKFPEDIIVYDYQLRF